MRTIIDNIKSELFFIEGVADISTHEGYKYDYDKRQALFGTRVGPVHSIEDGLLHELAHAVELKNLEQLKYPNFGLEIKRKVEVLGRVYLEPITWNATKLELRTILWQEVLCNVFGIGFDAKKFSTALQYMPDFMCVPIKGYKFDSHLCKYVNEKGEILEGTLKEKDDLRFQSMYDYMDEQKASGIYTYPEFRKRWDKAIEYLEIN